MNTPDFVGKYRILFQYLPYGAFANVFQVSDPAGVESVLKRLNPLHVWSVEERNEFTDEASRLIRLSCPNLVKGYDLDFDDENTPYFLMERASETLHDAMLRGLSTFEKFLILRDIASGIDYLHRHDLVHRDIKPRNIFLFRSPDGGLEVAKIGDLGLCRASEYGLSRTEAQPYAPVETVENRPDSGDPRIRARADVYSFGVVATEILTSIYPPFQHRSFPLEWSTGLPQGAIDWLLAAMHNEPNCRPESAGIVAAGLFESFEYNEAFDRAAK
jgi:eukaryotic-like serine/threonine-protein kinase